MAYKYHPPTHADGSERVAYNHPDVPVYIQKGALSVFENYCCDAHFHTDFEFMAILEGIMQYNINGTVVDLQAGDVLFVNSGQLHFGYSEQKKDSFYYCLLVHPKLFSVNEYIRQNYVLPIMENSGVPFLVLHNRALTNSIEAVYRNAFPQTDTFPIDILPHLFALFRELALEIEASPEGTVSLHPSRVKHMLSFVTEHYAEPITLSDIAEHVHISPNTCIADFQKYTHQSPIDYLTRLRMEHAKTLLSETKMTVSEIAFAVGFHSSSYFIKTFKQHTGQTPGQFRT